VKFVELTPGIYSSALGFGCSQILGSINAEDSRKAVNVAFGYGINHFDLARSYGYGDAEHFIGKLLKGKRHQLVLASKFGIKANWKASILRPAKPLFRKLTNKKKQSDDLSLNNVHKQGMTVSNNFLYRLPINVAEMRISLEESLKALKTDFLDYYLIHEPLETLSNIEDLIAGFNRLKEEGKIRAFGINYYNSQILLHNSYLQNFRLHQFDNVAESILYQNAVIHRGLSSNIIFSPLKNGNMDLSPSDKLRKLLTDFPKSVVLASMFNENHIKQNVDVVKNLILRT
jgi:aryl-alcohol dehydrogenase-like predicted oxidoreductase